MNRCSDYVGHYTIDAEQFDYFANQDPTDAAYEQLFHRFILKLAGRHSTVVDIGSGGGWTSAIPHDMIAFVDLSKKNLSALKSMSSGPVLADAHRLPFMDESVEFVVASEIVEHLNEPEAAAREIWRILRPGGKAIISTPYKERIRYTLCIHCNKMTPWNSHLHSFDASKLFSLFPDGTRKDIYVFGSKLLTLFRAARVFRKLPLWIWRCLDYPLVRFFDKAQHIVIVVEKAKTFSTGA